MRPVETLLAVLPALVGLAGCTGGPADLPGFATLTVGDAWVYETTEGEVASHRAVSIAAVGDVVWGNHSQSVVSWNAFPRPDQWEHGVFGEAGSAWTSPSGAPLGWAMDLAIDAGVMSMHEWTDVPCAEMPEPLALDALIETECRLTYQRVMPGGTTMERRAYEFTRAARVVGEETVDVPAGRFRAWHIEVAESDATGSLGEYDRHLWFSPEACAVVLRTERDYEEKLAAGSCASTGWSHGDIAGVPAGLDVAAGDAGRVPVRLSCHARATGAGANGEMVQAESATCAPGFHGFDFDGLAGAHVTAEWQPTPTVMRVHLDVAGMKASSAGSPVAVDVSITALETKGLNATIRIDGATPGLDFRVTYLFRSSW